MSDIRENEGEKAKCLFTLGVVADTHVPDRCSSLHPGLLPALQKAGVDTIVHAGDISLPSVVTKLETAAPVYAVRGNRDLLFGTSLPMVTQLDFCGVQVALMHGHVNWGKYLRDKTWVILHGYHLERFLPGVLNSIPEARVVIFGHTHFPENSWINGRLVFNPGSSGLGYRALQPSYGILRFHYDRRIESEICYLDGYRLRHRKWKKIEK